MSLAMAALLAASEADGRKWPRVEGMAYTGAKVRVGFSYPLVMRLSGGRLLPNTPMLANHQNQTGSRLGLADKIEITDDGIPFSGDITSDSFIAKDIATQADRGAEWQVSIGIREVIAMDFVDEDEEREVNGVLMAGPFYDVQKWTLGEVSIVPMGADHKTRMRIAATIGGSGGEMKTFEMWLTARGIDAGGLTEAAKAALRLEFDGEVKLAAKAADGPAGKTANRTKPETEAPIQAGQPVDVEAAAARAVKVDRERQAEIRRICLGAHDEIEASAIETGETIDSVRAKVLAAERAARPPAGVNTIIRSSETSADVLEAALYLAGRGADPEKHFAAKSLELASGQYKGGITFSEVLLAGARANGYMGMRPVKANLREIMEHAFPIRAAAGFSTLAISGILSNTANKFSVAGFDAVESVWRSIASIRNVNDFKLVTGYRLTGGLEYDEIAPGGQFKHGTLGEDTFTNQAKTYGKMLAITREDIINDDLGKLTEVPFRLGRGGGLKLNKVVWSLFMDNGTFFTSARGNYFEGAATNLSIDSLTTAEQKFLDQTDGDGYPVGIMPKTLLVPTALSAKAAQLMNSTEIRDTTASTKYAVGNPHAGKFTPQVSAYLSNAAITGNSSTAFYLLADPMDEATIEVCFLNGQQAPTIEQTDADFSTLGIQMRGFHDFGAAMKEYRAGVKSKGAA